MTMKRKVIGGVFGLISGLAFLTALIYMGNSEERVIEDVLALQFVEENQAFTDMYWNPENQIVKDGVQSNPKLDAYMDETYGEYFTESALETFARTGGATYPESAGASETKLFLEDVAIKQNDKAENRYTFVATVGYQKENEEKAFKDVEGLVLFSTKEDKIGSFTYTDDNGLAGELQPVSDVE